MNRTKKIPSYRRYKTTGQGVVVLAGKYHYLGLHGTPESHQNNKRTVAEWLPAWVSNGPMRNDLGNRFHVGSHTVIREFPRRAINDWRMQQ